MNDYMNNKEITSETEENVVVLNEENAFPTGRKVVGKCPRCGGNVSESPKGFFCEASDCRFAIWKDNRYLTPREITVDENVASELLENGRVNLAKIKSVKTGNYYSGILVMEEVDGYTRYRIELDNTER